MKCLFIATFLLSIITVNSLPVNTNTTDSSQLVTINNEFFTANTNEATAATNTESSSVEAKAFGPYNPYGDYLYGGGYGGYPNYNYGYYQQPYPTQYQYQYQYQRNPSILGAIFGSNGLVNSILGTGK
ncbi:hypothetical protein K502DRAFT_354312 [Neoconidiobolus thromboides FSU 785]|nr:hypothetical protein K502DRAFT_354312 [Neoconidiobolus thromboides FSU 785]